MLAFGFFLTSARADDKPKQDRENNDNHNSRNFNPDKQLSKSACGDNLKDPIINVTQKVQNDVDSGLGLNVYFPTKGNYWNVESYTRHIKVWSAGENKWCATVAYDGGKFNAFYKQTGPAGTGLIGADVNGEMHGGYRSTMFTGTFTPTWPTNGNVGTFNYDGDLQGNVPGKVDWLAKYFPDNAGFDFAWWGWIYNANDHHGTWINSADVNSGNIL